MASVLLPNISSAAPPHNEHPSSVRTDSQNQPLTEMNIITSSIVEVVFDGPINVDNALSPENWTITSRTDRWFRRGVHPERVERFTTTLNADDRDRNGQTVEDRIDQHRIYLYLPKEMQFRRIYQIEGTDLHYQTFIYPNKGGGIDGYLSDTVEDTVLHTIRFGDAQSRSRAFKMNQVSYNANAQARYIYIGYWLGSGGTLFLEELPYTIYKAGSRKRIAEGTTKQLGLDTDSQEDVWEIDISSLPEGTYYIDIDKIGRSELFSIGNNSFAQLYTAARGLYHQRAGTRLTNETTDWTHERCHAQVYKVDVLEDWGKFFPSDTPQNPEDLITLPGGWYDAGDFDRRPLHLDIVDELAITQEVFADQLADINLNIPESQNTIPDLLDEALYGLSLWEQLQEPEGTAQAGGVRAGVESYRHPEAGTCENDTFAYWTYSPNQYTSYRFAAAASNLGRLLIDYNQPERGQELIDAAERAFTWAEETTGWDTASPTYGTTSPSMPTPTTPEQEAEINERNRKNIARVRLAAAGNLFAATGQDEYQTVFADLSVDTDLNLLAGTYHETIYSLWGMAIADHSTVNEELQASVRQTIQQKTIDPLQYLNDEHRYRSSFKYGYSIGNGNATIATQYVMPFIMAYHFDPKQSYIDAVSLNMDYQLGANANGTSWVTGLGYNTTSYPLHLNSMYDEIEETVPGLTIYGPFPKTYEQGYCPSPNYWQCLVYNGFYPTVNHVPGMYQFAPWAGMAPMNEFTVWQGMGTNVAAAAMQFVTSGEHEIDMSVYKHSDYPLHPRSLEN